jgi:hypothetical protein
MTLTINVDGADLPNRVRLAGTGVNGGFQVSEGAEVGSVDISNIGIEDPDADLIVVGLRDCYISESAATPQRLFTGSMWDRDVTRGPFRDGAARQWECHVRDVNERLVRRLGRARAYQRPAETDLARLTFLLGSSVAAGLFSDLGLANQTDNPVNLDEANYVGKTAMDILVDMAPVAGKTAFLYYDEGTDSVGLFYDKPGATGHDSSLRISNVLSDVDDTTTFEPLIDATLHRSPEDTYSGILFGYKGAYVYETSPTTVSTYAERELAYSTDRVGKAATATSLADQFLVDHGVEFDTISVTVVLPQAKVNGIRAGQRISVKFSHIPDFTGFTWTRVVRRQVSQREDLSYILALELSTSVFVGIPNGGTGGFPHSDACSTPSLVQSKSASGITGATVTMDSSPTAGNLLVCYIAVRQGSDPITAPTGFTAVSGGSAPAFETVIGIFYRTVVAGDSATVSTPVLSTPADIYIEEWAGNLAFDSAAELTSTDPFVSGPNINGAVLTPTAGKVALIVGMFGWKPGSLSATTSGLWTERDDTHQAALNSYVVNQMVASTSGSYTPVATTSASQVAFDDHSYCAQTVAFACTGSNLPPDSGQWVYNEIPTPAPDGSTVLFTLANNYAAGSLRIRVDGVVISPASYTETSTSTFTLSWAPDTGEVLSVDYQGI